MFLPRFTIFDPSFLLFLSFRDLWEAIVHIFLFMAFMVSFFSFQMQDLVALLHFVMSESPVEVGLFGVGGI